jgi:hypothetical protein
MLVSPKAKGLAAAAGLPEYGIDRFVFLKHVLDKYGLPPSHRASIESLILMAILSPLQKVVVEAQWGQAKISGMVGGVMAVGPFMGNRNGMWNDIKQYVEPIWIAVYEHEKEGKEILISDDFKRAQECIKAAVAMVAKAKKLSFSPPGESIHAYNGATAKQELLIIQSRAVDWQTTNKKRAENGHKKLQDAIAGILQHPKLKDPVDQQAPETSGLRGLTELDSVLIANLPQILDALRNIISCMVNNASRVVSDNRFRAKLSQAGQETNVREKYELYHIARVMESVVIDAVFPCFVVNCLREFKRRCLPSFAFFDGNAEEWWGVMRDLHFALLEIFCIGPTDRLACLPTGVELEAYMNMGATAQNPIDDVDLTERTDPVPSTDEVGLPPDWLDPAYESLYIDDDTYGDNEDTLREASSVRLPEPTKEEENDLIDYSDTEV